MSGSSSEGMPRKKGVRDPARPARMVDWEHLGRPPFSTFRPDQPLPVMVVLDWMSGTQSLKRTMKDLNEGDLRAMSGGAAGNKREHKGIVYVGLDSQRMVFSHAMQGWVRNLKVDLMDMTYEGILRRVQRELDKAAKRPVAMTVVLLAMSPCCRTFSKVDSVNGPRGEHYRLHGTAHPTRPPRDNTSKKGKLAHMADAMVQPGIQVATEAHTRGSPSTWRTQWGRRRGGRTWRSGRTWTGW